MGLSEALSLLSPTPLKRKILEYEYTNQHVKGITALLKVSSLVKLD